MNDLLLLAIAFFGFLAVVILIPVWLRHRSTTLALQTISKAVESGRTTEVAFVERLLASPRRPVGTWFALINLVLGVPALCIGVALGISAHSLDDEMGRAGAGMMVGSLVNGCAGVGLTTLGLVSLRLLSGRWRPAPEWNYGSVLALAMLFLGASGLSVGTGLSLAANLYMEPVFGRAVAAGMMTGALVNAFSGIGFLALGVLILRAFATAKDF